MLGPSIYGFSSFAYFVAPTLLCESTLASSAVTMAGFARLHVLYVPLGIGFTLTDTELSDYLLPSLGSRCDSEISPLGANDILPKLGLKGYRSCGLIQTFSSQGISGA